MYRKSRNKNKKIEDLFLKSSTWLKVGFSAVGIIWAPEIHPISVNILKIDIRRKSSIPQKTFPFPNEV